MCMRKRPVGPFLMYVHISETTDPSDVFDSDDLLPERLSQEGERNWAVDSRIENDSLAGGGGAERGSIYMEVFAQLFPSDEYRKHSAHFQ